MNWDNITKQLTNFLKTQVVKVGFNSSILGISGGLDSAIVAILLKKTFDKNFKGILLPSQFSSSSSLKDAKELCEKFDIDYEIASIEPMLASQINNLDNDKLRIGNLSARLRMSILYDLSAKYNSLVIGTSNKSEILLGYGTIFGDMACAINPLGNIYKSDEFEFGKFLGVPKSILDKKPSADLWEGQSDEKELGWSYKQIDEVLKLIFDKNKSQKEILDLNIDIKLYNMIIKRYKANRFKSSLPIIATLKDY